MSSSDKIVVGARGSLLSQVQVEEVLSQLRTVHPQILFEPIWVNTTGDKDQTTSLRTLEKTDFFTREIDALQQRGDCRISIHSAKDLPDPLPQGLTLIALTQGVDPSDVLVFRGKELPLNAKVATSSERRERNLKNWRSDVECVDIRGSIPARLECLERGEIDAVVVAEAALIRLQLTHLPRTRLPGEVAPLQGQLAILAREGDTEMIELFSCIDMRKK